MEGALTMTTSIAGKPCNLQIFRHCLRDDVCYSVDLFEQDELKGIYYMTYDAATGEYNFASGQVPYNISSEERNIANSILNYYNSHCNERAVA
ncbi:MAG: hypothetical protein EOP56_13315 [Sphingobacteriales bacterium]|nr:MAG: hypothetical protein EOP56_13315 [Sphingobacteriales bacterium]